MTGTSIRNIKRNKSEKAVSVRCARHGSGTTETFKYHRETIRAYFAGLFSSAEYGKHKGNG